MWSNIPKELQGLSQWVVAGDNKIPVDPRTGRAASPTDPSTWASFSEACNAGYKHIGFVLENDPYTVIDLDDPYKRKDNTFIYPGDSDYNDAQDRASRQGQIMQAIDSYKELSQSGRGVHIVVRGTIPAGVRRDAVEVYSRERYIIFTGNVISDVGINDYQGLLDILYNEMASTDFGDYEDKPQVKSDGDIYSMASRASNSAKFLALYNGDITAYPSQSEADFALITIFAFYSKNDEQVRRLFRYSALGKREKAQNDDYINRSLAKIRPKQHTPMVDLTPFLSTLAKPAPVVEDVVAPSFTSTPVVFPPGLVGHVAQYLYSSATRPVPEIALSGAIAFVAGVIGRSFNISGTGLNQYVVLVAKTGTGKEGVANGIEAIISALRRELPIADDFIGPANFASGQALLRLLTKKPCFLSIIGEFGLILQQMCDKNAAPHNLMLRKVLLDLFAKSGRNSVMRPSVYSDQEKNTEPVRSPCVTILGETTPENFYGALDGSHIAEGLAPRFLLIEYTGGRPPRNPNAFHRPSAELLQMVRSAMEVSMQTAATDNVGHVGIDHEAQVLLDEFDLQADERINGAKGDVDAQLWNRSHIKVLKLAALLAVGCNLHNPIVTKELVVWAINLVNNDVHRMLEQFNSGAVGQGDHQQENDLRKAVLGYAAMPLSTRRSYKVPNGLIDKESLIPYTFLKRYLIQRASFKNDRGGAINALQRCLNDAVRAGTLQLIPAEQALRELGTTSPVYVKGESW